MASPQALGFMLMVVFFVCSVDHVSSGPGPACRKLLASDNCNGNAQSPIDIDLDQVRENSSLSCFRYTGYNSPPSSMKVVNDGKTLKLEIGDTLTISGGGLPDTYRALQLHFHWGSVNSRGSEHTVDGQSYSAEMHIVHYNTKYTPDVAVSQPDGMAVLGFLMQVGEHHPGIQKILAWVPMVGESGQEVEIPPFSVEELLPCDRCNFFRYHGSLTTPPCHESVTWTVFDTPICISNEQLQTLRTLMVDNFRPVQPLNGRVVHSNEEIIAMEGCPDEYNCDGNSCCIN